MRRRARATAVAAALASALAAWSAARAQAAATPRTYCNPLDLDYRYNFEQLNEGISYRSGADPVIVRHGGAYYLFETIGGGYWRSADLARWEFVAPSRWPLHDVVAPAVLSIGDTLVLMQSATAPEPLLYTTAPARGTLEFYNRLLPPLPYAVAQGSERPGTLVSRDSVQPGPWDPALFLDDDGRAYLYWGSSNVYPLYGIELDRSRRLAYRAGSRPVPLLRLRPDEHGWERFGRDHGDTIRPYVEGAWMTKHGGRYYLQYAAPGTEYNVYANGTYVGRSPLGPFEYAPYNPVSYRPGGFATGAGHGNTFADANGDWWNTGTTWIGVNWNFERRIVLHPAGFDDDGDMYATTRFGDFPQWTPGARPRAATGTFTGWMLLSYRKPMRASSSRAGHEASLAADEDARTYWLARTATPDEWLAVDLGRVATVRAVQVSFADHSSGIFANDSTVYTAFALEASDDAVRWRTIADLRGSRRDRPNAYVELARPERARWIRYRHAQVASPNLAIAGLRVFGTGAGPVPATPRGVVVTRHADERDATVRWEPVPGAVGYNVLWGIGPAKLHQSWQRWNDQGTSVEIRALTVGQRYWFAVEAFGESGVSRASTLVGPR